MVNRSRVTLVALALLALGLGVWSWLGSGSGARAISGLAVRQADPRSNEAALPRIGLERLKAAQSGGPAEVEAGRDLFRFGRAPAPPEPSRPVSAMTPPPPPPVDVASLAPPPPTAAPPFGVKYVGTLEQRGNKIAVLLSDDKKEILYGREGDTVANRLKIVKIGLESVEVQDIGSERVRRIPLKGN